MLLTVAIEFNLKLEQMDIKTAFLCRDLEETIYLECKIRKH